MSICVRELLDKPIEIMKKMVKITQNVRGFHETQME